MRSVRKLSLLLLAAIFVFSLVACGGETIPEVTVTVNARDMNGEPLVLGEVTFAVENPTVLEALKQMCAAREVACDVSDIGIVNKIGSVGASTYTDKETGKKMAVNWSWKLNGKDSEELKTFANATAVKTGDTIEFYQYAAEVDNSWSENAAEFEKDDAE